MLHLVQRGADRRVLDTEHVLFVPDENLARYVQTQTTKTILSWEGNCYVHHQITPSTSCRCATICPTSRSWSIPSVGKT